MNKMHFVINKCSTDNAIKYDVFSKWMITTCIIPDECIKTCHECIQRLVWAGCPCGSDEWWVIEKGLWEVESTSCTSKLTTNGVRNRLIVKTHGSLIKPWSVVGIWSPLRKLDLLFFRAQLIEWGQIDSPNPPHTHTLLFLFIVHSSL